MTGPEWNQRIIEWVTRRIPGGMQVDPAQTVGIALINGDTIKAGVLYSEYRPRCGDVCMSVAALPGAHWATRANLCTFFEYPFIGLGCRRVTAVVARKNKAVRRFDEKLGFILEGKRRKAMPNHDDAMLYGMLKEECRWLEKANG